MRDFIGRPIKAGDHVVYCTRHGSRQDLRLARVIECTRGIGEYGRPNQETLRVSVALSDGGGVRVATIGTPRYIAVLEAL